MMGETQTQAPGAQAPEETRIDTHCYVCQQELPAPGPVISSPCGVNYHEECAKRVARCPVCGENLLEHFLSEDAQKRMIFKDKLYTILIFAIPFAIIEILIGVWSLLNHPSAWSIPPWLGFAFIIDLTILIVGIIVAVLIIKWLGYKQQWKTLNALVIAQKGPTPGIADEQLYTCGYGGGEGRLECADAFILGDVSIPVKLGVQRENIVKIGVDRLTKTPEDTFLWVNPRFIRLLKPKEEPRPSTPQELEKVWLMSGRTKIMPKEEKKEEEVPPEEEEKRCSTCGSELDFIAEYDAWYCTSCGKYQEVTVEPDQIPEGGVSPEPQEPTEAPPDEPEPPEDVPPPEGEDTPPDESEPPEDVPPPEGEDTAPDEPEPPEDFPPPP
ncbi:MAG: E3 ubiquitin protein ligase [Thermoplasmata archaeon]|nr:MAG: E3 ubiquitin protein ligase [Thermoplasmata archaeon]